MTLITIPGRHAEWPTRPPARGRGGMVATTQPMAVEAGLGMLRMGGTAADAAVAVAATLFVTEPRSNGLGGDLMALYWPGDADGPVALNASGRAPAEMTVDAVRRSGETTMPSTGPWSATVPGAVAGLAALHERFGTRPFGDLLHPAIQTAEDGFSAGQRTVSDWRRSASRLPRSSIYLTDGPPTRERIVRLPILAKTLRHLADEGPGAFYRGRLASLIADHVASLGGPLREGDLADHAVTWERPIEARFRGRTVYELGHNTQGSVVTLTLGMLDRRPAADGSVEDLDMLIRAIRLAFDAAARNVGDAAGRAVADGTVVDDLTRKLDATTPSGPLRSPPGTDTVFTAIADAQGGLCAMSTSLYDGFGSGVEVPDTGIVLHNRAAGFSLKDEHNLVAPGRRPFHTLVPAMTSAAGARAALGFVGAFMQPQAQVQTLRRMFDEGYDPQAAIDAPRLRVETSGAVSLENRLSEIGSALTRLGYRVGELPPHRAGTGQLVALTDEGLVGASDQRHDGRAEAIQRD